MNGSAKQKIALEKLPFAGEEAGEEDQPEGEAPQEEQEEVEEVVNEPSQPEEELEELEVIPKGTDDNSKEEEEQKH